MDIGHTQPDRSDDPAHDSAVDRVVASINAQILSGKLRDGQSLPPERRLVEELGVSRTVAREAIKKLAGKGLIESLPRHRPVVRRPDQGTVLDLLGGLVAHLTSRPGGVRQLFELRIFTEAGLVRRAAQHATKDDIVRIKDALAANRASIDDSAKFYETDKAFHATFYRVERNPIFPSIHRAFAQWLDFQWRQMPRLPERNRRNFEAHETIVDAILERDPDAAEKRLRDHLEDAWNQVSDTFGKDDGQKE